MALKNFTQFTPQTVLSATDFVVGYRDLDEIRTDLSSLTDAISGLLVSKGFTPGGTVGSVVRVGFRYTIASGNNLNAVSGFDDFGSFLLYNAGAVEVYRNGAHLVENLDYQATNGTQVRNLSTLNVGDIVEVSTLSGIPVTFAPVISGGGQAFIASFRYTVNTGNTIVPNATLISGADDYGAVLNFISPNLEVYLNGSHLIRDIDYGLYSSGSSFTLNDPVTSGDVLDVITLSGYSTTTSGITAYSSVSNINRGKNILVSQTSGVVTISAKSDICSEISLDDVPVPGWTDGQHISRWSLLQDYLSATAITNTSPASAWFYEYFGSFPGAQTIDGGVLHPNGKIYCNVTNGSTWSIMRVIDPNTNTVSTFNATGQGAIAHGSSSAPVVAPNGRIFFVPYNRTFCMYFDPSTNTFSTFAGFDAGTGNSSLMNCGVLAPNGKIYFAPFNDTVFRFLDPDALTINAYATITGNTPSSHYYGATLAPNGKIYFIPSYTSLFRVVDPATNTVQVIGTILGSTNDNNYIGGVLATNGKIYCLPRKNSVLRIIDPSSDIVTAVTTYAVANLSSLGDGGVLAPNGKIYFNTENNLFAYIDPDTYQLVTLGTISSISPDSYHNGGKGIIAPNGKMYFMPYNNTQAVAFFLLNKNNFNLNVCTNPMFK